MRIVAMCLAIIGCDAYEFDAQVNFVAPTIVSFDGAALDPGDTVSLSYPTYEDARDELVIFDVIAPDLDTSVGIFPVSQLPTGAVLPDVPRDRSFSYCRMTLQIDPTQTPLHRILSVTCEP